MKMCKPFAVEPDDEPVFLHVYNIEVGIESHSQWKGIISYERNNLPSNTALAIEIVMRDILRDKLFDRFKETLDEFVLSTNHPNYIVHLAKGKDRLSTLIILRDLLKNYFPSNWFYWLMEDGNEIKQREQD